MKGKLKLFILSLALCLSLGTITAPSVQAASSSTSKWAQQGKATKKTKTTTKKSKKKSKKAAKKTYSTTKTKKSSKTSSKTSGNAKTVTKVDTTVTTKSSYKKKSKMFNVTVTTKTVTTVTKYKKIAYKPPVAYPKPSTSTNITGIPSGGVKTRIKDPASKMIDVYQYPSSYIRKIASRADKAVLDAFETLGIKLYLCPKGTSYAGVFSAVDGCLIVNSFSNETTIYHELGHFVSWISGCRDNKKEFASIYEKEKNSYPYSNKLYSIKSAAEYYASSYYGCTIGAAKFSKACPETYKYIRQSVNLITPKQVNTCKKVYGSLWK